MNKATFLKNLTSIIWSKTWPSICWYGGTFLGAGAIIFSLGQISLWCGMPPMGSEDMGNAITKIPQFDNGLAVIVLIVIFIIIPLGIMGISYKAVRDFARKMAEMIREAADKSSNNK